MCLKISEASGLSPEERAEAPQKISALLEAEEVAYDIKGHKEAAPNLRIWGGPTVDPEDIEALDWTGAWYFVGAGVMHFLIGRYTNYKCK